MTESNARKGSKIADQLYLLRIEEGAINLQVRALESAVDSLNLSPNIKFSAIETTTGDEARLCSLKGSYQLSPKSSLGIVKLYHADILDRISTLESELAAL